MSGRHTPAAARFGGSITRRHAALLLQSGIDGGDGSVCVKDLRIRRVIPPASASLESSSPECAATAKPGPVESTPPEAVSPVKAAAVEDLDRKPVLPRSKLVRDPGSFGYRRLLPFLNQMTKSDYSKCNGMPSENMAENSAKEFKGSRIWLFEESAGGGYRESDPLEPAEPVTVKTGGAPEIKDGCDIAGEETNAAPHDFAGNKPCLTRCTSSRFVHHKSSFSYKRLLPFLMDNEISSREGERIKIRRVEEGAQLTPYENDAFSANGKHHLAPSKCSSDESKSHPMEATEEEKPSNADGKVLKVSSPERSSAEVQNVIQEEASVLSQDPPTSRAAESTSDGIDVLAGEQHLHPVSEDFRECKISPMETIKEQKPSNADGNQVLKVSSPECSSAEVQNVIQGEASVLSQDPPTSRGLESTSDGIDVLAGQQHLHPVSEDVPEECSIDVTETIVQDKALKSDGSYVLELVVAEVSPLEGNTSGGQKATEDRPLTSDGDEGSTLTSDKNEFLTKEKPQLCDTTQLLTAQVESTVEFSKVLQCQSSDLGCPDVGFGSPTKTVVPLVNQHCSLEYQDAMASVDDPHLDAVMICRPSDPCAVDRFLSVEEMSGALHTKSGSSKSGILRPSESISLGKRGPYPKKLSPRKGILKRHTRGCKGICMCLDCSTYRLRADRAFEFSRKQMQEADDIIGNILKEMSSLRSLVEKPAGQRASIQAACQRAFQVEEVARDRCHQMFVDLNSHCRIPGPRVKFAQYVEEKVGSSPRSSKLLEDSMGSSPHSSKQLDKMGSSPRISKHVEDNMGSSPRSSSSFGKRRCLKS